MAVWQKVGVGLAALAVSFWFFADARMKGKAVADDGGMVAAELQTVPPDGFNRLSEPGLQYFQAMGPLEYATRLSGVPETPVWRVRLRLYPQNTGEPDGFTYDVKVDHYNLSPALYQEVANSYGVENTDPSLNNQTPHQHLELAFMPIMNVTAEFLSEATQATQSAVATNAQICGLGIACAALRGEENAEWATETTIPLEAAPWDAHVEPLYALTRALAQQAGWLQTNGMREQWTSQMPPEGVSEERPWVEVLVENYAGNGGGYLAEWVERVADDSVSANIHRIYYFPEMRTEAFAQKASVCARGEAEGQIRSLCP